MREAVIGKVLESKIIAIVRGAGESAVPALAEALYRGGIRIMELTFDPENPDSFAATASGIAAIRDKMAGRMVCGAGTVLTPEQAALAADAGAQFIVSPNADAGVIKATRGLGLVSIPGAFTASEAVAAHDAGADFIKLFPAGGAGPGYLKTLCAPLCHLRFLAVGGIDKDNAADFLRAGAVGLGVGGNLVNRGWIQAGEFAKITQTASKLVAACSA